MMTRRRACASGALALALTMMAGWALTRGETARPSASEPPAPVSTSRVGRLEATTRPSAPPTSAPAATSTVPAPGTSPVPPPLARLLAEHDELAAKAVPLGADRDRLRELVSDPAALAQVRARLLAAPAATFDPAEEAERIAAVRFISSALRFRQNPLRDEVTQTVREVVLAENHRDRGELRLKRSLVGDKIELFAALVSYAPEAARDLQRAGQTSANQKIVAYAAAIHAERLAESERAKP